MHVQVHAEDAIQGGDALLRWAQETAQGRLARLKEYLPRVDVYFSAVDQLKEGGPGKRCVIETHVSGRPPLVVTVEAEKVDDAFPAALDRLIRAIDADLGKLKDRHGRDTIRSAEATGQA